MFAVVNFHLRSAGFASRETIRLHPVEQRFACNVESFGGSREVRALADGFGYFFAVGHRDEFTTVRVGRPAFPGGIPAARILDCSVRRLQLSASAVAAMLPPCFSSAVSSALRENEIWLCALLGAIDSSIKIHLRSLSENLFKMARIISTVVRRRLVCSADSTDSDM